MALQNRRTSGITHGLQLIDRQRKQFLIDRSFAEPLRRLTSLKSINDRLRAAAERAAERLVAGEWTPRQVLMHGDLWKGNILVRMADRAAERRKWCDRFVIIDWAGSEIHGYAMYDLVRLAQSMRLSARSLRSEVDRHCRLLRCEPAVLEIGPGLGQFTTLLARRARSVCALEVVPGQAEFAAERCRQEGMINVHLAVGGDG